MDKVFPAFFGSFSANERQPHKPIPIKELIKTQERPENTKMGYDKNYLVKVFAERTRANLETIKKIRPDFKITQLINSCLGLLVFPRKACRDRIPKIPLDDLVSRGWPIPSIEAGVQQVVHLRELVVHLRNAIAHGHLKLYPDKNNQIKYLRFRDKKWRAKINVDDLWDFVEKFSDMLISGGYCFRCSGCYQSDSDW
jgi:hypothetical protein